MDSFRIVGLCLSVLLGTNVGEASAKPAAEKSPALSGPRDYLRTYGFDDSHFAKFRDGRPLAEEENEPLIRVLYWLRRFDPVDVDRWSQTAWLTAAIPVAEPPRGAMFHLSGRLKNLQRLRPLPEMIERFEMPHYYRCEVLLEPNDRPAVIFTETVPQTWPEGGKPQARIGARAMFLKFAGKDDPSTLPLFAATRLAWYPETLLGNLGFDYGLFDEVAQKKPLRREEREAFHQMLAAAGRAQPGEILAAAKKDLAAAKNPPPPRTKRSPPRKERSSSRLKKPDYCPVFYKDDRGRRQFSVFPLFFEPKQQLGKPFVFEGTTRQVEKIFLGEGDRDMITHFGFDHYYEIMLTTDDSGDHPITFCVRELPPGLSQGSGPGYAEYLRIAGFFYKVWSYKIPAEQPAADQAGRPLTRRQRSPLLIGRKVVWYPPTKSAENTTLTIILGAGFVVVFVLIWVVAWRLNRGDRRFFQSTIVKPPADRLHINLEDESESPTKENP